MIQTNIKLKQHSFECMSQSDERKNYFHGTRSHTFMPTRGLLHKGENVVLFEFQRVTATLRYTQIKP